MPLKIADPSNRRFRWPVTVLRPEDCEHKEHQFTAVFLALTTDEIESWRRGESESDKEILRKHLVGWEDVSAENGEPLAFTEEARDQALRDHDILIGLGRALQEAHSGRRAERKN